MVSEGLHDHTNEGGDRRLRYTSANVRCVLGFLREGVGDLGRNWLEKTSRSRHIETALYCDELEDERLNVLQIMAVKLVAA